MCDTMIYQLVFIVRSGYVVSVFTTVCTAVFVRSSVIGKGSNEESQDIGGGVKGWRIITNSKSILSANMQIEIYFDGNVLCQETVGWHWSSSP